MLLRCLVHNYQAMAILQCLRMYIKPVTCTDQSGWGQASGNAIQENWSKIIGAKLQQSFCQCCLHHSRKGLEAPRYMLMDAAGTRISFAWMVGDPSRLCASHLQYNDKKPQVHLAATLRE